MPHTRIPKKKMLTGIGMNEKYDVYVTPRGEIWLYSGQSKEDYNNPKFWEKPKSTIVKHKDKEGNRRWRHTTTKNAICGK